MWISYSSIRRSISSCEAQIPEHFRYVEIWDFRSSRLPGKEPAGGFRADTPKKIATPGVARTRFPNRFTPGNLNPNNKLFVSQTCSGCHSGCVIPVCVSSIGCNFKSQIYPFARRRSFELKITRDIIGVRGEENLAYITIP